MFDEKVLEKIQAGKEKWDQGPVAKTLAKSPEAKPVFTTISGTPVERLYTPLDVKGLDYDRDLGYPGMFPYTRGVQPTMYRGRYWTMRQYAGFGDAKGTNERYRYLLGQGQTGLSVAFHLPTQAGYDSDHPLSMGEVGKVGVAIDHIDDMRILFDQINLGKVSTSMTINAAATVLLAMYLAIADEQGVPWDKVAGTVQNDVLKEIICRGQYVYPPKPTIRLAVDLIDFCQKKVPRWNTISISGYHIRESGSTAAQEMAFTIADGIAYAQACVDRGMDVDAFAGRLSFFFNAFTNVLEEVAKFLAGGSWAKVMRDRFKAKDPRSMMLATITDRRRHPYGSLPSTTSFALVCRPTPPLLAEDSRWIPTPMTRLSVCPRSRRSPLPCAPSRSLPRKSLWINRILFFHLSDYPFPHLI